MNKTTHGKRRLSDQIKSLSYPRPDQGPFHASHCGRSKRWCTYCSKVIFPARPFRISVAGNPDTGIGVLELAVILVLGLPNGAGRLVLLCCWRCWHTRSPRLVQSLKLQICLTWGSSVHPFCTSSQCHGIPHLLIIALRRALCQSMPVPLPAI